ncbi:MAG: tripartite tricarboxylate transporter TctB family protein [Paracoccaceae bacterium]|nr:tripartite tricarboxylate transporter TctB family protein [Paracoccaceae bacterium]
METKASPRFVATHLYCIAQNRKIVIMTNAKLDRALGVLFVLIGSLVTYGAALMPRYGERDAQIYEAPGFTPALLGIALAICGVLLAFRPASDTQNTSFWDEVAGSSTSRKRAGAALGLTLTYGGLLFGRVPYFAATFVFVFAFICTFELLLRPADKANLRPTYLKTIVAGAVIATLCAGISQYAFETVFLVQLP